MFGSKKLKNWLFCKKNEQQKKQTTSTREIGLPSTSETAGENESDDVPAVGPTAVKGKSREKTQKYSDSYLKFGFTFKETDGIEFPMCVICSTVLSSKMKPSKLQRHLETTHSHVKDKPVEYFQIPPRPTDIDEKNQSRLWASFEMLLSSCSSDCSEETVIHTRRGFNIAFSNWRVKQCMGMILILINWKLFNCRT